jgi:hypothetical protein
VRSLAVILGVTLAMAASDGASAALSTPALLADAESAEAAADYGRALARYDEVLQADASTPSAASAAARLAYLRAHAEGGFAPLARLERVRRAPDLARSAAAIEALVHDAEAFPPGRVRVETWAFAADAYAERLARPDDARRLRTRLLEDPHGDDVLAAKAARDLVDDALARGDLGGAESALREAGSRAPPDLAALVRRARRRRNMHIASISALAATALLASAGILRRVRSDAGGARVIRDAVHGTLGPALVFAAWVGAAGGVLANAYEGSDPRPFLALGGALLPMFLLARAWSAAAPGARLSMRAGRAVLCAVAALGVAFLVLEGTDARYLKGLGL